MVCRNGGPALYAGPMPIGYDSTLHIIAGLVLAVLCAYGGGRVHQWYTHGMERDRSFRDGFNHGYHALFPLAARSARPVAGATTPDGRNERERLPD